MPLLPGGDTDLQQAIFEALQAGRLRLVGADGLDRAVGRPGEIGVGQSSIRLAKPESRTSAGPADGQAANGSDLFGESVGSCGSGGATGSGDSTLPIGAATEIGEQEVAFTLMTSLTDDTKRESVRLLLRNLANAIDEGAASYAQLSVRVIVNSAVAEDIAEDVRAAGTNPTTKKV